MSRNNWLLLENPLRIEKDNQDSKLSLPENPRLVNELVQLLLVYQTFDANDVRLQSQLTITVG